MHFNKKKMYSYLFRQIKKIIPPLSETERIALRSGGVDIDGQIFTIFVLTVAAAEAAIGLAIIVVYYRNSGSISVEDIKKLRG